MATQDDDEARLEERRERRELAHTFAEETKRWSSHKLRMHLAQPEKVQQAEERERLQREVRGCEDGPAR